MPRKNGRRHARRPRRQRREPEVVHVMVGVAPRKPSELEIKAKAALVNLLGAAERDPDRVLDGFAKLGVAAERAYKFVEQNPKEAKKIAGKVALSFLAGVARKRLEK